MQEIFGRSSSNEGYTPCLPCESVPFGCSVSLPLAATAAPDDFLENADEVGCVFISETRAWPVRLQMDKVFYLIFEKKWGETRRAHSDLVHVVREATIALENTTCLIGTVKTPI